MDVFLFADRSLFGSAIKHLLDDAPGLSVVGWEEDAEAAAQQIQAAQPAVIVVVANHPAAHAEGLLAAYHSGAAKVVTVNLDDSVVVASTGETCRVEDVGDFISQLRNQSPLRL